MERLEVEAKRLVYRKGEDIKHYYDIGDRMGSGDPKLARTFKAKHKITGDVKAVKIQRKKEIKNTKEFIKAVELHLEVDYPGILTYSEVYEDDSNFYMVADLMHAEMMDFLSKAKRFTENNAAYITLQMLQSLNYLHQKGIVHRNIRPSNVLVKEEGKWEIRLIDFDFFKTLPSGEKFYEKIPH
jgi:serine/threonine protein kinase